jgi:hypothetical protein
MVFDHRTQQFVSAGCKKIEKRRMLPGTDHPGSITTHLRENWLQSQHQTSRGVGLRQRHIYWHPTPRLETRYRTQAIRQGFDSPGTKLLRYTLRASAQHMNPCAVCRRPGNTTLRTTASSLRLRLLALELPRPRTPVSSDRPQQAPAQQRLSSTPQIRGAGAVSCANAPGLGYHVAKFRNSSIVPRLAAGVIKPAAAHENPNGGLSHASRASSPSSGTPHSLPSQSGWGSAAQSWERWLRTPKPTPA